MIRSTPLWLILCLLVASCSKSTNQLNETNSTSRFIDSAHNWFLSEIPDVTLTNDNILNWSTVQGMTFPDGIRILEIPLKKQESVVAKIRTGNNIAKSLSDSIAYTYTSLIIYHSPLNGFYYAVMKIIGDDGYINRKTIKKNSFIQLDRTFTGVILLQKWDGSFIKGSKYNNGQRLSPLRITNSNATQERMDCIRTTVDFYQQVCRGSWCDNPTYLYSTSTLSCVWTPDAQEEAIDYKEPSGDGGGWNPPPIDISEQQMIRIDKKLQDSFPCAVSIINQLRQIHKFFAMVEPFSKDLRPDLVWRTESTMNWGPVDYVMGRTWTGVPTNSSSTIELNPQGLYNASTLLITTIMIHEVIHAHANYYINWKTAGEIPEGSWITSAFDALDLQDDQLANARDHQAMMNALYNDMVDMLKEWGGARYTEKEYKMAALYGLDNAGQVAIGNPNAPQPTPEIINRVNTLYQNLKNTHNISDADMNTFKINNLKNTPAAKKLPKTGC